MHGLQSLFLESLSGQQAQAAEVALAQAAAREAVGERGELEHMLTWLTGAHAEEAAMHRTFKAEVPTGRQKQHGNEHTVTNLHPYSVLIRVRCSHAVKAVTPG